MKKRYPFSSDPLKQMALELNEDKMAKDVRVRVFSVKY